MNAALGLRSLTLQTGDEYLEKQGFDASQVAVVIGSALASRLHGLMRSAEPMEAGTPEDGDAQEDGQPAFGVGTDAQRFEVPEIVVQGSAEADLPHIAERVVDADKYPRRRRRLLATPVLVSTLDTLMHAASRNGSQSDMLRVATADTVIDEYDSYSDEDIVAICRLARIVGAHGRHLVISTATLRPEHAVAARQAYAAGCRDRATLLGGDPRFVTAWVSEHGAATSVDDGGRDNTAFEARHRTEAASIAEAAGATRRRTELLEVAISVGGRDHWRAAAEGSMRLHQDNAILDPTTGVRVSVGIVRWNRVRSSRDFARHLLSSTPSIPGVRTVALCLHANFAMAVRALVDGHLGRMLSRKCASPEGDPLLRDPHVRRHLEACRTAGETDLVIVVSATPVIEAGRDVDADWCIAEPCSDRSVVQLSGRVRRHRPWKHEGVNVLVLQHPVSHAGGAVTPIEKPGVETPMTVGRGDAVRACLTDGRTASAMFPMARWGTRLDASACLVGVSSTSGAAETAMLRSGVLGQLSEQRLIVNADAGSRSGANTKRLMALSSTAWLTQRDVQWTTLHGRMRLFRRQDPSREDMEIRRENGVWMLRSKASVIAARQARRHGRQGSEWVTANNLMRPLAESGDVSRLLFPIGFFHPDEAIRILREGSAAGAELDEESRLAAEATSMQCWDDQRIEFVPSLGMIAVKS